MPGYLTEATPACRQTRALILALTLCTAGYGAWLYCRELTHSHVGWWAWVLVPLFTVLFTWVVQSFWIATLGFVRLLRSRPAPLRLVLESEDPVPLISRTAILMPVYNESPHRVFAGIRAMYEAVQATGEGSAFDFFVLSDTTDPDVWLAEEMAWARLNQVLDGASRVYYRHRPKNTGRKAGNIADFCRRWGALYTYMIVLDADSVMSAETMREMVARMEQDDAIGILQVPPVPVNRSSLFARCQQFAAQVYGPTFLEGFAAWAGTDGNYWGHNAVIRVDAFARCCGLPKLPGSEPLGGEILSHDFVEAALMRRAGYKVCLAHDLAGSYEECPPTLLDFAQRDQRWCQGNMQHLRVLVSDGLHPVSRLHLGMGVMSYLSSPLWLIFLVVSFLSVALPAGGEDAAETADQSRSLLGCGGGLFLVTMALLLLPKFWSYLLLLRNWRRMALHGGAMQLAASILLETAVSILVAPIMMAFHSRFVVYTFCGRRVRWDAQERTEQGLPFRAALGAHWQQTLAGLAAAVATWWFAPEMFAWLTPIFAGLVFAVPLSMTLSSTAMGRRAAACGLLRIPEEAVVTQVLERHRHLLSLPALKDLADQRGMFHRVLADPAFLALHRSNLEATGAVSTISPQVVRAIEKQLLTGGTRRISPEHRKAILSDPVALRALHLFAWTIRRGE